MVRLPSVGLLESRFGLPTLAGIYNNTLYLLWTVAHVGGASAGSHVPMGDARGGDAGERRPVTPAETALPRHMRCRATAARRWHARRLSCSRPGRRRSRRRSGGDVEQRELLGVRTQDRGDLGEDACHGEPQRVGVGVATIEAAPLG